jgi:hypothetical protein
MFLGSTKVFKILKKIFVDEFIGSSVAPWNCCSGLDGESGSDVLDTQIAFTVSRSALGGQLMMREVSNN